MAEYDISFAALRYRYSPLALAHRNVRITGGDDLTITVTVYDDEDTATLSDLTMATPVLYLYRTRHNRIGNLWDYGFGWASLVDHHQPILTINGFVPSAPSADINFVLDFIRGNYLAASQAEAGQVIFSLQPWQTIQFHGRYGFAVFLATPSGLGQTILRGIMDIERGIATPFTAPPFILGTDNLGGPDVLV